jgi:tetratricopeptide (TPR) repeat protein
LENDLDWFAGVALVGVGRQDEARVFFERASTGSAEPVSATYYNDQPPDMIFYQGLALRALRREKEAVERFRKLIDYGIAHLVDHITIDYFAVSLPEFLVFEDDLDRRNVIHCRYMMALGYMGIDELEKAREQFEQVLAMDASHLGATVHRKMLTRRLTLLCIEPAARQA